MNLLREKIVDLENKKILVSYLFNSKEAEDKYTDINCEGYGRIRRIYSYGIHYSSDIFPKKKFIRNSSRKFDVESQVFQIAGCNWHCWYCFVDKELVCGDKTKAKYFSASEIVEMCMNTPNKTCNIDLSGGNPDIAPEWCLWVMKELDNRGLRGEVSLWVDDNLGTDYLFTEIRKSDRLYMASFPKHIRLCCIKGYDNFSVSYNVCNQNATLDKQIERLGRLIKEGFEVIVYLTFVGPPGNLSYQKIEKLFEKIYSIDKRLPLRCIPIIIKEFHAQHEKCNINQYRSALKEQKKGFVFWEEIVNRYYTYRELSQHPQEVKLCAEGKG